MVINEFVKYKWITIIFKAEGSAPILKTKRRNFNELKSIEEIKNFLSKQLQLLFNQPLFIYIKHKKRRMKNKHNVDINTFDIDDDDDIDIVIILLL